MSFRFSSPIAVETMNAIDSASVSLTVLVMTERRSTLCAYWDLPGVGLKAFLAKWLENWIEFTELDLCRSHCQQSSRIRFCPDCALSGRSCDPALASRFGNT